MVDKILRADSTQIPNVQSCTFKEQVNSDENLRFGSVAASSIEFVAFGSQTDAPASGEQLTYYQTDDNGVDTLIGIFTAQPSIPSKNTYRVIAYDNIINLKADFTEHLESIQSNFPMTLNALMSEVASVAGVVFANTPSAGSTTIEAFSASGVNCQQVVAWAAEMSGQFVRCNTSGEIEFAWYAAANNLIVKPGSGSSGSVTFVPYRENGLDYRDYAVDAVARVAVQPPETDGVAAIYPSGVTGNTYTVQDNLLLTGASVATLDAIAQSLFAVLSALPSYRPCDISLFRFDNPFRAGDIVDVEDIQGVTFKTLVMSMISANDGASISCTGQKNYEADAPNVGRQMVNLAENVVRIDKLKVGWAEIDTAIINYLTANDVTAQNLTIVDASDNVIATFNDNGITFYNGGNAVAIYNGNAVTLGENDGTRAVFDANSFELYDKDGNLYAIIGDMREDGLATIQEQFYVETPTNTFTVAFPVYRVVSVTPSTGFTFSGNTVILQSAVQVGTTVTIVYETISPAYRFDLGTRKSGGNVGAWSVIAGYEAIASALHSAAIGGSENTASGAESTVVGGSRNSADGDNSFAGGGLDNHAIGNGSSVVGGATNTATGTASAIIGGTNNAAAGSRSATMGNGNNAKNASQFVFGEFNELDPSSNSGTSRGNYVEIVGNGSAENARSNARTLDWNGNETLAGMLYCNGNEEVALKDDYIVTEEFEVTTSIPAGTIGTRGAQVSTDCSKTGYTLIGAWITYILSSANYNPMVFKDRNGDTVYCNFYRATASAVSTATCRFTCVYKKI